MDTANPCEFNPSEAGYALARAYIPEHIPNLMVAISRAIPFLIDGYLGYVKDNWIIFVGYPLEGQFDPAHCGNLIERVREVYHPDYIWFIGPEIPPLIAKSCRAHQRDQYYRLDLTDFKIKSSLQRQVKGAARKLTVEQTHTYGSEHQFLADELMQHQRLPPMVEELYRSMPEFISQCVTARVLNARDSSKELTAFFVIETAAEGFDTYMLGCYSKKKYVPHASDLLFSEMIALARQRNKPSINLGLGVNPGIRRFKVKWGGIPYLEYEFCECYYGPPIQVSIVDQLLGEDL